MLSEQKIRALALERQFIHRPWSAGLPSLLQHLGALQLDAIQRITRAHHHQLYNRLPGYRESHLAESEQRREIFEYWSHAAAYLPMAHYPYARVRMDRIRAGQRHWFEKNTKLCRYVLDRVGAEGPLRASDFVRTKSGWWKWSDEKKALEQLFHEGELMVSHREGFQKVFDLPERILPAKTPTSTASQLEYSCHLVRTFLGCQGTGRAEEIAYLRREDKPLIQRGVKAMLASGELSPLGRELILTEQLERSPARVSRKVRLLSPFDPLILQRKRLRRLFEFEYQLECYVPAAKRRYGYFCLPILYADRFVGLVDLKADRSAGLLRIDSLHWKEKPGGSLKASFHRALGQFARFHGLAREVRVTA
ncbi:winged helix DNA-binding domain-containing protein [Microbulbifer sp. OS29]|uniref:Winged helix DNA-binding domain-containing protein n=1 Tax=Microbulbifer okhotskensis TaxID=2926617 RepID=A0A9X2EM17_9GAMM|nr:crosslink repair DNA glycosylase YcaQ family protein [Microbulbifer okhotskensis]MCO1334151.1 winged helix DNA-binding domain-containing protein [Microbulbifer okhotskensis]